MEEVDSIILYFLRQLNISIDESIKNLCDLPVEIIIESASTCIQKIDPSIKVAAKIPFGISHRIEVAATLASICKDLGYKNDVGYQTFLYYNECELRQVFMFLIEMLPNESNKASSTATIKKKSLLIQDIGNKIGEGLKSIWVPPCCSSTTQTAGNFKILDAMSYTSNHTPFRDEEIVKKLLEAKEIKDNVSLNSVQDNMQQSNVVCKNYDTNKSLKELKDMAIILQQKLDTLQSERNVMAVVHSQAQRSSERAKADLKNVVNILNSIGISEIESDGGADNILEKVQKNINMLHKKSEELTSKNLSLKIDTEKLKNSMNLAESERSQCKKALGNLKETARTMKEDYDSKEVLRNQLKDNYDKLRRGNKRSVYTKRIMEIISNVDKQNMEIKKILEDTRQIQKEINSLEGQLDRCFSIADEALFKDAKKDDQAKKAYKLLALLHSECNTIVSLVNEMGTLAREIVDLEENIKIESAKKTEDTLRKIQLDLTRIQEER